LSGVHIFGYCNLLYFAKWAGINRSGFHYFYDPIVLDLDGDGMITTQRALFNHNNISILAINEERWAT